MTREHQDKENDDAVFHENKDEVDMRETVQQFDNAETRKILRKVDWRVLPILSFLYLLAFLDRSNLGNARVAGLEDDLQLTGSQFNLAATVSRSQTCASHQWSDCIEGVLLPLLRPRGACQYCVETASAIAMDWVFGHRLGSRKSLQCAALQHRLLNFS